MLRLGSNAKFSVTLNIAKNAKFGSSTITLNPAIYIFLLHNTTKSSNLYNDLAQSNMNFYLNKNLFVLMGAVKKYKTSYRWRRKTSTLTSKYFPTVLQVGHCTCYKCKQLWILSIVRTYTALIATNRLCLLAFNFCCEEKK